MKNKRERINLNKVQDEKDFKEFLGLVKDLGKANPRILNDYKNRMLGAVEISNFRK